MTTPEVKNLMRKIDRLEAKIAELTANSELAEMMALDIAPEAAIASIEKRFPTVVAGWRERK